MELRYTERHFGGRGSNWGVGGCSQCCVSSTGGAEGGCPRTRVVGGVKTRRRLGAGAQRLGEEAKWTRGRPEELAAGGIREWWSVAWGIARRGGLWRAVALLCARSEMGEGGSRNGQGYALEPSDARALASLVAWLDELGGDWLRGAVAC